MLKRERKSGAYDPMYEMDITLNLSEQANMEEMLHLHYDNISIITGTVRGERLSPTPAFSKINSGSVCN